MLNLMKGVLGSPIQYEDKIMYLTSVGLNHSIGSDKNVKNPIVVESILDLITSSDTSRYMGLQLLELALQQNADNIYNKGKWITMTYKIIKESGAATLEKNIACKILTLIIPYVADDPSFDAIRDELIKDIYPTLLEKVDENVEWALEACITIRMILKTFPNHLAFYQGTLLNVILHQASCNVSSKSFEVLAECFCEVPYCTKDVNAENIQNCWQELYLRTLKTIESLQISCLSYTSNSENYERLGIDVNEFIFNEESDDGNFFPAFVRRVRRFVNLCKCLTKLLSVKSRYPVKVPIQYTVKCLIPIYTCCRKDKLTANEEVLCTFIAQMRLAGLAVLESLILNCNLLKNAALMKDIIKVIIGSAATSISSEFVSELRTATWRFLSLWLDGFGRSASKEVAGSPEIIEEILKDINIDPESLQVSNAAQAHNKSKKSTSSDSIFKSVLKRKNQQKVCEAALNSLESLLCTGTLDFPKEVFQEICNRVFKICHTVYSSSNSIPLPYDDESCREKLYSTVLTIMLVIKPDEYQILQTAMKVLVHINKDPSFKVRKLSNKASLIYRLQLYPKRPLPVCSDNKHRRSNVSNEVLKYSEWSSQEYVQNIETESVSEASENVNTKAEQSFQSESEMEVHTEDYMEVETNYSEQVVENQCNGEEMLEIQSSSHCQDDVESDEEEEEEEEEQEKSFEDEEINQEEPVQEMSIPPSRKVQASSPLQINSETVQSITEAEYEELAPCTKTEENALNNSNTDNCINGESNITQEDMPSSSTQVANENGVYGVDDDDLDEENDEDEEEESESFQTDKRTENFDTPSSKRQKIENKDNPEVDEKKEKARSPTLEEMKADFLELLPSIEDVKSGKVQFSTS